MTVLFRLNILAGIYYAPMTVLFRLKRSAIGFSINTRRHQTRPSDPTVSIGTGWRGHTTTLENMEGEGAPRDWVEAVANILGPLVYELQVAALAAEGIEWDQIEFLEPVVEPKTGKRGRPKKNINLNYLREATSANRNIKLTALAAALGVHRNTLRKRMQELGIHTGFDALSDNELDQLT
ncbi:hypothetical protein DFH07DRAFT_1016246 [Mycena maculata]|uniref:PucR C-terminal helix-turn-helix domain-containing protein n=1 Tax=Mycena maculata TaxID=230809 RepID=A0AAD7NKN5_9AGAR|nr:hypothetical protein DFH07DRAFT_1016246 [Mycena maculata]